METDRKVVLKALAVLVCSLIISPVSFTRSRLRPDLSESSEDSGSEFYIDGGKEDYDSGGNPFFQNENSEDGG